MDLRYHLWTSNNEIIDHTSRMYVWYVLLSRFHSIGSKFDAITQKKMSISE